MLHKRYYCFICMYYYLIISFALLLYIIHKIITRKPKFILNNESKVLITGASMGIGRETILYLAKRYHCKFIVIDIRSDLFQKVSNEIQAEGSSGQFYKCDLSNHEELQETLNQIIVKFPKIDLLINNAGITIPKPFKQITHEQNKKIMEINFFSPIYIMNRLLKNLHGGHIVTIASVMSFVQGRDVSVYCASKHAIYGFMNCVRMQLQYKKIPITTSIICPYAINTGMFDGYKTKLDRLMPMLDQKYVAEQIVKAIINRSEVAVITQFIGFNLKLLFSLPFYYRHRLYLWLDKSNFDKLLEKKSH